jgi:hypothetical protein
MMQEGVKAIRVMKIDGVHEDVQRTTRLNTFLIEQFILFCSLRLLH